MRKPSLLGSSASASANNKHNSQTYDKNLNSAPDRVDPRLRESVAPVPPPKRPSMPKGPYGWTSRNPFDDTD